MRYFLILAVILQITKAGFAQAKEEPLYLVEMLFFLHTDEANKQAENWPKNISLDLASPQAFLVNDSRESIYPDLLNDNADKDQHAYPLIYSYRKGQEDDPVFPEGIELALREKARQINGVGRYQFLQHIAFAKRIDARFKDKANNIIMKIDGETKSGQAFEIAGSFTLHKNRFLHLNTNLWISYFNQESEAEKATAETTENQPATPISNLTANSITEPETLSDINNQSELPIVEEQWPALPVIADLSSRAQVNDYIKLSQTSGFTQALQAPRPIELIAKMSQARKMRSKETHYIDHPLFGVIIEIREFPMPVIAQGTDPDSE
jgi:hypothetical protein